MDINRIDMSSRRTAGDTVLVGIPGKEYFHIGRIDKLDSNRVSRCELCGTTPDNESGCLVWPNVQVINPLLPHLIEWVFHVSECRMFDYMFEVVMNPAEREALRKALLNLALNWRKSNPEYDGGVVLIRQLSVYGWKDSLRDVHEEKPGAYAIDVEGNIFVADGGDSHSGANRWVIQ